MFIRSERLIEYNKFHNNLKFILIVLVYTKYIEFKGLKKTFLHFAIKEKKNNVILTDFIVFIFP